MKRIALIAAILAMVSAAHALSYSFAGSTTTATVYTGAGEVIGYYVTNTSTVNATVTISDNATQLTSLTFPAATVTPVAVKFEKDMIVHNFSTSLKIVGAVDNAHSALVSGLKVELYYRRLNN